MPSSKIGMEEATLEPVAEVTDLDRGKGVTDLHRIKEVIEVQDLTQGQIEGQGLTRGQIEALDLILGPIEVQDLTQDHHRNLLIIPA
jgi:hypothetical protein